LRQMIQNVDVLLGQCIDESRSLTMELSPPILYDGGLAAALEWLARQMLQSYGLAVEVEADPKPIRRRKISKFCSSTRFANCS